MLNPNGASNATAATHDAGDTNQVTWGCLGLSARLLSANPICLLDRL